MIQTYILEKYYKGQLSLTVFPLFRPKKIPRVFQCFSHFSCMYSVGWRILYIWQLWQRTCYYCYVWIQLSYLLTQSAKTRKQFYAHIQVYYRKTNCTMNNVQGKANFLRASELIMQWSSVMCIRITIYVSRQQLSLVRNYIILWG